MNEGQRSTVNLHGVGAYCDGLLHSLSLLLLPYLCHRGYRPLDSDGNPRSSYIRVRLMVWLGGGTTILQMGG